MSVNLKFWLELNLCKMYHILIIKIMSNLYAIRAGKLGDHQITEKEPPLDQRRYLIGQNLSRRLDRHLRLKVRRVDLGDENGLRMNSSIQGI